MPHPSGRSSAVTYAALTYLIFVIYGSLVPLDFHALPWATALQRFADTPWLAMGHIGRADWVANLVLYLPLAFLTMWALRLRSAAATLAAGGLTFVLCVGLAVGVEFTQLFFPPRTVSLNDILAEALGSGLGIVLWLALGKRVAGWAARLREGGSTALSAAFIFYLIAYLAVSFFPYDFVVSAHELAARLANGRNGWVLSSATCSGTMRCGFKLIEEALAVLPLGLMLARWVRVPGATRVLIAVVAGAVLGGVIETVQLFLQSGISQGASILTRAAGMGIGAFIYPFLTASPLIVRLQTSRLTRPLALLGLPVYLVGLSLLQNWHKADWLPWQQGLARLPQVHFLPFYYHYYPSEAVALTSLLFVLVAYAPLGMLHFFWRNASRQGGVIAAALLGASVAGLFEFAKLFQSGEHPDPTNLLLGAVAAAASYGLLGWLSQLSVPRAQSILRPSKFTAGDDIMPTESSTPSARPRGRINPFALVSAGLLLWAIAVYPLGSVWLAAAVLGYALVLWRWPQAWLVALPAALPVLDLAPFTGRFFVDELDYLLLVTLAVAGWHSLGGKPGYRLSALGFMVLALFAVSQAAATLIGAYPFPPLDANSFSNYYSHYNALRVAKGLLWALLLVPLLKREFNHDAPRSQRLLTLGMTLGVLLGGLSVLWERVAFTGLFNFTNDYRVVGLFSGMHTGGAYIEGYFATALPFVVWWTLKSRSKLARLFGFGVFALGGYALLVTYARGGYIALLLGMVVLGLGLLLRRSGKFRPGQALGGLALLLVLAGIAWPVLHGSYMQSRFSTVQKDAEIRTAHWEEAVGMMDGGVATQLFGMGLGRYPETYFWRNSSGVRPATYRFVTQANNTYLELGAGDSLYFEQLVAVQPDRHYQLSVRVRASQDGAALTVPLCEKWMLYSAACVWQTLPLKAAHGQWQRYTLDIDTRTLPHHPWYAQTSVKLSLYNPKRGVLLDIDSVSLRDETGHELLRNGDFEAGMDDWFFATDNHLPWHFKDLWLQIYFEQGILGLSLFGALVLGVFLTLAKRYREPDFPAPVIAAALVAFLTVGVIDSLFDSPRMALLFYLLVLWTLLQPGRVAARRRHTHRPAQRQE